MGSHVLNHILATTDWDVVALASWKHMGTPERLEQVLSVDPAWKKRVTVITHDLESPVPAMTKARIGDVDYIFNVAAESHVDRSIVDPVPFVQNNVNLVLNMLELARSMMIQRISAPAPRLKSFIQISTDEVYGAAPQGHNHAEWESIIPSNPYSASKAAQEAIAISYWRTYGVPVIITNTMNLFGEMQSPEKYTAQLIRKINNGEVVTVHGTPGKIGSRFYLHARNQADALLYVAQNLPASLYVVDGAVDRPDRYNIVGDLELDNLELAQKVADALGKELKFEFMDFHAITDRPGHDRRYALDGSKLKSLGWKAPVEFDASLKSYIDWTLAHPEWL